MLTNRVNFTTYRHDAEADFEYAITRYYRGPAGSFLERDLVSLIGRGNTQLGGSYARLALPKLSEAAKVRASAGAQANFSISTYAYVGSNPFAGIDPLGLQPVAYPLNLNESPGNHQSDRDAEIVNIPITIHNRICDVGSTFVRPLRPTERSYLEAMIAGARGRFEGYGIRFDIDWSGGGFARRSGDYWVTSQGKLGSVNIYPADRLSVWGTTFREQGILISILLGVKGGIEHKWTLAHEFTHVFFGHMDLPTGVRWLDFPVYKVVELVGMPPIEIALETGVYPKALLVPNARALVSYLKKQAVAQAVLDALEYLGQRSQRRKAETWGQDAK